MFCCRCHVPRLPLLCPLRGLIERGAHASTFTLLVFFLSLFLLLFFLLLLFFFSANVHALGAFVQHPLTPPPLAAATIWQKWYWLLPLKQGLTQYQPVSHEVVQAQSNHMPDIVLSGRHESAANSFVSENSTTHTAQHAKHNTSQQNTTHHSTTQQHNNTQNKSIRTARHSATQTSSASSPHKPL